MVKVGIGLTAAALLARGTARAYRHFSCDTSPATPAAALGNARHPACAFEVITHNDFEGPWRLQRRYERIR